METPKPSPFTVFSVQLEPPKWDLAVHVDWRIGLAVAALALALLLARYGQWRRLKAFHIEEGEFSFGPGKVTFRPSYADLQVAYAIWVELSTRKIGLPIDLNDDVIVEIYNSWYAFFGVTRDLIKSIPAERVGDKGTRAIVDLSIAVLNEGVRPHLTRWQARFRTWFEQQLKEAGAANVEPQALQSRFPKYEELKVDLLKVNADLMVYREAMRRLVYGPQATAADLSARPSGAEAE